MSNKRIASSIPVVKRKKIYNEWLMLKNKTAVANKFGISTRTVGRIVKEFESETENSDTTEHLLSSAANASRLLASIEQVEAETPRLVNAAVSAFDGETVPYDEDLDEEYDEYEDEEDDEESSPVKFSYFLVATNSLINITRVDPMGSEPSSSQIVHAGDPKFDEAMKLVSQQLLEQAYDLIDTRVEVATLSYGKLTLDPARAILKYKDGTHEHTFSASLTNRAIELVKEGGDVQPLLRFAERLLNNPSPRAVNELYDFLVASDIQITDEGMVRCYKRITSDWKDVYTRSIDNSIGATPTMKRFQVDDNSAQTCSHGLHVCSRAYLRHYGGERVVQVDVDPADFVSIPQDYYSIDGDGSVKAKARVCRYTVVAECDTYGYPLDNPDE